MIGDTTLTPAPSRLWSQYRLAAVAALLALLVLAISPVLERARTVPASTSAARLSTLPLAAQGLVSRTLGRDQVSYRIHRSEGGLAARNEAQGLSARFGVRGVQVRSGEDAISLRLRAAGYGHRLLPVAPAAPTDHANRVSYRRGTLTEWYVNGPLGLEQGFTLRAPPAAERTGSLTLALSLAGSLRPALERGARTLTFAGSNLRYAGLTAFDARGRKLPARLDLRGQSLLIRVDDAGARYPLVIDPFFQVARLTASDGAANDQLGSSVAISGSTIVAGSYSADVSGHADQGAVYVFAKPAGGWASATQTAKLTASDGAASDHLGWSVAIAGDTIVAGARNATVSGHIGQGAAYVFVEPAGGWASGTQTAKLTASDGAASDQLGGGVAIDGDTIVAGATTRTAYVFLKPGAGWASGTETARLSPSDDAFLRPIPSVAIDGDTIAVGLKYSCPCVNSYFGPGAVYVFVKPAGGWVSGAQTAKLTAYEPISHGGSLRRLGESVAIEGDTIVAGDPGIASGGQGAQGAVYVFVKPNAGWTSGKQRAKLTALNAANYDHLGVSVGIADDTIVAGADPSSLGHRYVYVFLKPAGGWTSATETEKVANADGAANEAVAIAGDTLVAGAPYATVSGHSWRGAAYVFSSSTATITVKKDLVPASDPGRFDLKIGGKVVKVAAGDGGSGSVRVIPGAYRVSESAAAGTSMSGYATSIACTINGNPGPSGNGTAQLNVSVAANDQVACTITNRRKATITVVKHLVPASDPGRFDLKVGGTVVAAGAGDGGSGSRLVAAGTYTVSEAAAADTSLPNYTSSISCTRNGGSGPAGNGTSLNVKVSWGDVLVCTINNQRK